LKQKREERKLKELDGDASKKNVLKSDVKQDKWKFFDNVQSSDYSVKVSSVVASESVRKNIEEELDAFFG